MKITRLGNTFAARADGVDPRRPLTSEEVNAIEHGLAREGVLVFRDMLLNDDQQQAFIERFGPPSQVKLAELKTAKSAHPHFFDVSTVEDDGGKLDPNSARGMYLRANLLWHTDGSQAQPPIRLTALSARRLPAVPPDTEYADMRAAYDELSPARKAEIENMKVEHSIFYSRSKMGMKMSDWTEDAMQKRPPVVHPLVRVNPLTGRKSLYLASHASHVIGMPLETGRALIEELTEHATQRRFVYSHAWRRNDLVIWDNRTTMHRVTRFDETLIRDMRRTTVAGIAS